MKTHVQRRLARPALNAIPGACLFLPVLILALTGCQSPCVRSRQAATTNSVPAHVPLAILHGPWLQAPSDSGITVSWVTSRKCVSRVEYRPETSAQWLTNLPAHHGLVDADVTHHNVRLSGLQPGVRHVYRTVSREIEDFKPSKVKFGGTVISAEFRFAPLNPGKTHTAFVVLNDRHEKIAPLTASLASVAWTNIDLAFFNGDMVNDAKDEQQFYRCLVDPCVRSFASTLPMVYIRGNHDARGSFARRLLDYFPTESGRYYYALHHGPVSFLALDSGEDKTDASAEYSGLVEFEPYMRQQVEWLARQIETPEFKRARFRVCFLHLPPAKRPDPKFIRQQWLLDHVVPLLNRGQVDLLICAHTHKYAIQPAGQNGMTFPMITGGTETLIQCDATADTLRVQATDLSGKALPQLPSISRRATE